MWTIDVLADAEIIVAGIIVIALKFTLSISYPSGVGVDSFMKALADVMLVSLT